MKYFFLFFATLILPLFVLAANEARITEDVTLELSSDGSKYTLKAFSQADSFAVSGSQISFTLSQGGRATLESTDRKGFSSNAVLPVKAAITCESSKSTITLDIDSPFTTTTVDVTPSGTCSSGGGGVVSGGGGGGGGGGGYTPTPAPTPAPSPTPAPIQVTVETIKAQIAQIQQKIAQEQTKIQPLRVAGVVFTRTINPGERGDEVKKLQEFLARDKEIYPEGLATGFYGPATRRAVRSFQLKYGVIKRETDLGNGRVGPATKAKLNELLAESPISSLPAPASIPVPTPAPALQQFPVSAPAPVAPDAAKSVQEQVKALQTKLIQEQIKLIQERINSLASKPVSTPTPAPVSQLSPAPAPVPTSADAAKSIQEQINALQTKLIQEQIRLIQDKINSLKK